MFHPLTVSRLDHLTEDSVAVTLDVPSSLRETFRHVPGQHLTFRHTPADGAELRRTYSICSPASSPDEPGPERLTVGVRHIDGGVFSAHVVKELKAGDTLDVLPPAGRFTLPPVPGRYAAVVGGSGVTPVLSMVATLLARAPEARFTVLRCDRSSASTMFLEEFAELKDRYPDRLQLAHAFSREEQQAGLATGRMDADRLGALLPALLGPGTSDVAGWYLCGPLGLVEAAHEALRAVGVDRRRVHTELFHADAAPVGEPRADAAAPAGSRVTATLDGRSGTWPMEQGETLLETVLRNRADAPYACKGGVCGTCRVQLVSGEVGMDRNYALEPEEIAGGYVLACQSRPRTAEVAIDFDA
ncbi:2Fe-2S iron-sulfur cluster-binding protein [Streptomyces bohaiensis]|uniref:2Fe-2S iron-sulfur cluster binding domain-containing protein n=1 Tax=Streptomyces bohaiensis TaxID=1431344 RepID=A0ABX1CE38_9ACTN|nr:2Fe-2S iron-sulfur cluster-binding protein [Streptomyces bohaiensis]NJQ15444.1 2Fe-2S iron-sulfur cluster binding domain-containing protein [Streptomyces bohaiensis]